AATTGVRSEPQADAEDEHRLVRIAAGGPLERLRLAEGFLAHDAEIRRDLPPELVADPQARLRPRQAAPDASLAVRAAVPVGLERRLEDQPRGDGQLVPGLDPGGGPPAFADVRRRLELEPVGREPLNAERAPRPAPARLRVVPHARDDLPPASNEHAAEELDVRAHGLAAAASAFAAQPQPTKASAGPRRDFPVEPLRAVRLRGLETVEQDE